MKWTFLCLFALFISYSARAQYTETITTSRPGQAFTPLAVGKQVFQVQTGFNFGGTRFDAFEDKVNSQNYAALLRYGIWERIEFRTQFGLTRVSSQPLDESTTGFSALGVGTKYNFINGEGNKPKVGIQADFFLPAVSEDFKSDNVATTIILAHTQGLGESWGLSTNFGVSWDGNDSGGEGLYVVNFGFPISGNLGGFIETYGFFTGDYFDILFDTGLSYGINDHLVLDMSGGYGKNDSVKQFFVDFGLSWRTRLSG